MKINYVLLIIGMGIIIFGNYGFWRGFHNVDKCTDTKEIILEAKIKSLEQNCRNIKWYPAEKTIKGNIWSLDDCYLSGMNDLKKGIYTSMLGVFLFVLSLELNKIKINLEVKK